MKKPKPITHTTNKTVLSQECGFKSRQGLYEFMAKPGFPKEEADGWNIAACREFVLQNTEKEAIAANLDSDILDLKKWDIYERARKAKILNDKNDGRLISRSEHDAEVREMATECTRVLYTIPTMAPELSGLSVVEIERRLVARVDEAIRVLSGK